MKALELTIIFNRYCDLGKVSNFFKEPLHAEIESKIKELSDTTTGDGTGYETHIESHRQNTTLETAEFFTDFFSDDFIFQNVVYPLFKDSIKEKLETEFKEVSQILSEYECAKDEPNLELTQLIKERYFEGGVTMGECLESMTFSESYQYEDIIKAIDIIYEWDREDGMPEKHNFDIVRVSGGWIVIEKPSFETIHDVFRKGYLSLKSNTYTLNSVNLLDVGAIALTCDEETYKVDIDRTWIECEDGEIEIELNFNRLKDAFDGEEVFDTEKFDLSLSSLLSKDLKATIYVANSDDKYDFEFIKGSLYVEVDNEETIIPLELD